MPDSDLSARGALRLASSSAAFLVVFLLAGLILPAGAAFAVSNPALQIDTTSEPDSSDAEDGSTGSERPVFIGEVATFALTFDVAEGTTASVRADAILPGGLQYIAGSESVTVNDAGWTESATVTGGGASGADGPWAPCSPSSTPTGMVTVPAVSCLWVAVVTCSIRPTTSSTTTTAT